MKPKTLFRLLPLWGLFIFYGANGFAQTSTFNLSDGSTTGQVSDYSWDGKVLTVNHGANIEITGTVSDGTRVEVAADATASITLNGVSITGMPLGAPNTYENGCPLWLKSGATVNLTLLGANTLTGGPRSAGIGVPAPNPWISNGTTLTILAGSTGSLTTTGGTAGAGIGGSFRQDAGTITIHGGTITANGGVGTSSYAQSGAGIGGGGGGGNGGSTTITGGMVTANGASYGNMRSAGIGGGTGMSTNVGGGAGGTILISGGTVFANSANGAAIGGGGYYGGGGLMGGAGGDVTISGGVVTTYGSRSIGIGASSGGSPDPGTFTMNGDAIVYGYSTSAGISDTDMSRKTGGLLFDVNVGTLFSDMTLTADFEVLSDKTLTIPIGVTLTIPAGVTFTNNGTIIIDGAIILQGTLINNGTAINNNALTNTGTLTNNNTLTNEGTFTNNGSTTNTGNIFNNDHLINNGTINNTTGTIINDGTISGSGNITGNQPVSLSAEINLSNASPPSIGIGWTYANNVYTIQNGGDVEVVGSSIGTDKRIEVAAGATATITLNNVTMSGFSSENSPIVAGPHTNGSHSPTDLTIKLVGNNSLTGGGYSAGIRVISYQTLTIEGPGSLTASGGSYATNGGAGIGGDDNRYIVGGGLSSSHTHGKITINGGTITASGGNNASGIGSASGAGVGGDITINGGKVTAIGNPSNIGGGFGCSGGNIAINGGLVNATYATVGDKNGGAAIGNGRAYSGSPQTVLTMSGNAVVYAASVNDQSDKTSGILFDDSRDAFFYGTSVQPDYDFYIPTGMTLTVPSGATLTIPATVTLTNNGTVTPADGSTITMLSNVVNNKIDGANVANPTEASKTTNSVTLNPSPLNANTGQSVVYAYSIDGMVPASGWQDGLTFSSLFAGSTYYFYAMSKLDNNFDWGTASNSISITTAQYVNAQVPTISTQPQDAAVTTGAAGATHNLSVVAGATDGGTLTYQWYSNTSASNTGGTAISGQVADSYDAPIDVAGTFYYYVVITNTITDNGDGGNKTAEMVSDVATVEVTNKENAQIPDIATHPQDAAVTTGASGATHNLSVVAGVTDGGSLSYQWYSNTSASNSGGTAITGQVADSFNAPIDVAGTFYYYVVITNTITDNGDGGNKTATINSDVATIVVNDKVNAQIPDISAQPQDAAVTTGAAGTTHNLSVTASVTDGGALTYQWYSNTSASNTGGTAISGEVTDSYNAPIDAAGTFYYYVVITNTITDNGDGGSKTATINSDVATIVVNDKVNAQIPTIGTQPQDAAVTTGASGAIHNVGVTASVTDGGSLTYQWFSNTTASNTGGTAITGQVADSYDAPIDAAGTFYYYVVITNTITDNGDGGNKTAEKVSDVAIVTVTDVAIPPPPVPIFDGLEDEYTLSNPALPVPLAVIGEGSAEFAIFRVNGTGATHFAPSSTGTYLIEALSTDETLRIWKYVKILP